MNVERSSFFYKTKRVTDVPWADRQPYSFMSEVFFYFFYETDFIDLPWEEYANWKVVALNAGSKTVSDREAWLPRGNWMLCRHELNRIVECMSQAYTISFSSRNLIIAMHAATAEVNDLSYDKCRNRNIIVQCQCVCAPTKVAQSVLILLKRKTCLHISYERTQLAS